MAYDVVALNGGSFLALHDKPGRCPATGGDCLLRRVSVALLAKEGRRALLARREKTP